MLELALSPSPIVNPILRWAGSKRKIAPLLASYAPNRYNRYIEPFAGSAALFFYLQPQISILGDINEEVAITYAAIKNDPSGVFQYLAGIPKTKEAYLQLRLVSLNGLSNIQRAARLVFLMKGCFNGVYRTNKDGHFNVPFGTTVYNTPSEEELTRVSKLLSRTEIFSGHYNEWLLEIAKEDDFCYIDPPYSASNRFRGEYGHKNQFQDPEVLELANICKTLTKKGVKILFSYKLSDLIEKELPNWKIDRIEVGRSVGSQVSSRQPAKEILARNY